MISTLSIGGLWRGMPAPKPLTLCDPPNIDWSRSTTPVASDFGDIYFSTDGGLDEARTVFLKACGLPDRWICRDYFAIGELGFGTGLNFLATWQLWRDSKPKRGRLHFVSIEKFPLDSAQLTRALEAWPELAELSVQLIDQWPGRVKGFHHLEFDEVSLTLIHDDISAGLSEIKGKVDAWYLDGFSPSKNPAMWSSEIMLEIARLSNSEARLGTFTVARSVRDALMEAGYEVFKKPGFGRKRDRLEGVFSGKYKKPSHVNIKPVIIGAGIAGASLARSFLNRNIIPVVIDPDDGTAASGNIAAIIKPRLDLQDRPESRFFLSSYLFALRAYGNTQAGMFEGIQHLCREDKQKSRFTKMLENKPLPEEHFRSAQSNLSGLTVEFPKGLAIDPARARNQFLKNARTLENRAIRICANGEKIDVFNKHNELIASGSHVIWACGFGIRELIEYANLNLRYSRGQVSFIENEFDQPITYGGYIVPLANKSLIGATHKRLDDKSPFSARDEDDEENVEKYKSVFTKDAKLIAGASRSSVRVTTPSTLPLIFGSKNEWGLTGLGSRGFVFAPLLAEAIIANICGEVLPISKEVWTRFRAREKIQPENAPEKTPHNQ